MISSRTVAASTVAILLALCGLFLIGASTRARGSEGGNPLQELPGSLEDLLEAALESNPEVLMTEAKLREAKATVNQARLQVTQQVVSLYYSREEYRKTREQMRSALALAERQHATGVASQNTVQEAMIGLAHAESQLARTEAELRYAIGQGSSFHLESEEPRGGERSHGTPDPSRPPIGSDLRNRLETTRLGVAFAETPLDEVVEFIATSTGINVLVHPELVDEQITVGLRFRDEVSLWQLLHALSDLHDLGFSMREYGILITWRDSLPEDSPGIP